MTSKDKPEGWGLSSEQYDEDAILEVDTRSVDYDELRKHAKHPHATWTEDSPDAEEPARDDDSVDDPADDPAEHPAADRDAETT